MPHFKGGDEAKVGDRCRFKYYTMEKGHHVIEGLVVGINPGQATCNAQVCYPVLEQNGTQDGMVWMTRLNYQWVTLGECEKGS